MKRRIFYVACLFFLLENAKSQDSLKSEQVGTKGLVYSIRLYLNGGEHFKAKLMAMKDSSIYIFERRGAKADPLHTTNIYDESNWKKYDYKLIDRIKVHDQKLRAWTVLTGLAVGVTTAILISNANSSGTYDDLAGLVLGVILAGGAGAVTGVIIASSIE